MPPKKKYSKSETVKKHKENMEKLQTIIDKEIVSFKEDPENITEYLKFAARFYKYSPKNQMLIKGQNSNSTFVTSYMDWKRKGYQVEKGQSGIKIFAPTQIKVCTLPGEFEGTKLYRDLTNMQKEKIDAGLGRVEKKKSFTVGNVFDISQTNCPPEDYPKVFSQGMESKEHKVIFDALLDFASTNNITVKQATAQELQSISIQGYYSPLTDETVIRSDIKDTVKLATLVHELGHSKIHSIKQKDRFTKSEAQREFEADCYTVMLFNELGLPITDDTKSHMHNAYLKLKIQNDEVNEKSDDKEKRVDMINESMQAIMAQFSEAKETMIPHIQDYISTHENAIEYEPCPSSQDDRNISVVREEKGLEM